MNEQNELLRSAHEIAKRKGESTNWDAFENNLRAELLRQAGVLSTDDPQIVLLATVTPKTYRIHQVCNMCDGTGEIQKYFDGGDHFGSSTSPFSEWLKVPCPVCSAR